MKFATCLIAFVAFLAIADANPLGIKGGPTYAGSDGSMTSGHMAPAMKSVLATKGALGGTYKDSQGGLKGLKTMKPVMISSSSSSLVYENSFPMPTKGLKKPIVQENIEQQKIEQQRIEQPKIEQQKIEQHLMDDKFEQQKTEPQMIDEKFEQQKMEQQMIDEKFDQQKLINDQEPIVQEPIVQERTARKTHKDYSEKKRPTKE